MGRPLTGTCKPAGDGWKAALPAARGAGARTGYLFRTEAAARAWLQDGTHALHDDRPLPLPDPRDLARIPRGFGAAGHATPAMSHGTSFDEVGTPWADEYCIDLQRVGASREKTLRGTVAIIHDWMTANGYTLEQMHRPQVRALYKWLAGHACEQTGHGADAAEFVMPAGLDPDARVTFRDALDLPGLSGKRSTFERAKRAGTLTHTRGADGLQVFRIGDLYAAAGPVSTSPAGAERGRQRSTDGYVQDALGDKIWTFKQVVAYAREAHGTDVPTDWENLPTPASAKTKPQDPTARPVASLAQTAQVAARMHAVFQLALWLLRVLGVRISEAFGVRVCDVLDYGPGEPGLLWVHRQGGRRFGTRDPQTGRITNHDCVESLKRTSSYRVLVVPPTLMGLIRTVIAIFHTDAAGGVRRDARLIPGLVRQDAAGQAGFRARLRGIAVAARVASAPFLDDDEKLEDYFTPQDMRRGVLSELSYGDGDEGAQRRFAGHAVGSDVHARHYLLDDPLLGRMREIADQLETELRSQVGDTLMILTRERCTTGNRRALRADAARIDAALIEAGWLLTATTANGEPLLGSEEAAHRLGVTPKTVRQWMREGQLTAIKFDRPGGHEWMATLSAVEAKKAELERLTIKTLAAELGQNPHTVRQFITAQKLALEQIGERTYIVPPDTERAVRAHYAAQTALHARAMTVSAVAAATGLTVAEIDRHIDAGTLVLDERAHDGSRMITRESVAALTEERPNQAAPGDFVARSAAAQLLACDEQHVAALVTAGTLAPAVCGRQTGVARTSLLAYLTTEVQQAAV